MPIGQKHMITCRCILPQFRRLESPPAHQFVVFSVIEDDGKVRSKFVQCNNCNIVHKIIDICRSNILQNKDAMNSIMTIDDVKIGLPDNLVRLLEQNNADLPTWEAAQFIVENKQWGAFVVLTSDEDSGIKQGKYVRILGENLFKVESYVRDEIIK